MVDKVAKLYFRYGTMFSGKSTELVRVASNYEVQNKSVVILKPKLDTRDDGVVTRLGMKIDAVFIEDYVPENNVDCILVDEGQFLTKEQVMFLRKITLENKIPVIVYGLKTDFQNNLFEGSYHLLALSDKIEEIKTECHFCNKKATMNVRTGGDMVSQISVGHDYLPVCAHHYYQLNDKNKNN